MVLNKFKWDIYFFVLLNVFGDFKFQDEKVNKGSLVELLWR